MIQMKDIRKLEYDMLREASWKRMDIQGNLSLFVLTSTLTIFGIGFAMENPNKYIFLLPFVILLPSSAKVYQCKKAISCLAAYMIIFLETDKNAYRWETDGYLLKQQWNDYAYHVDRIGIESYLENIKTFGLERGK